MPTAASLEPLREIIREYYLAPEHALAPRLVAETGLSPETRKAAQQKAGEFVTLARAHVQRSGLIDQFLQEYGLSTAEGVTLMRLAEALLRTPDAATANALIEDKIEAGDWAKHAGKSPFPLVNFSTRGLMLTAAWLDEIEPKDPMRRMASATKAVLDKFGEPVIRTSVAQAMRIMGEHFVLGETINAATARGRKYAAKGYVFSYDMLGEGAHTAADAEKYFHDYERGIEAISASSTHDRAEDNPGISVKLSALHPRYEYGKKQRVVKELGERIRELALKAKNANMSFNIDAEEADRLDISLNLIEGVMRDPAFAGWDGFGVVVQSYLRSSMFVIDWLAALARRAQRRMMVRLVKGAYWDGEIKRAQTLGLESYPVFTRKVLTDVNYLACTRKLFAATDVFFPQFATHNALTAAAVQAMAGDCKDYELQCLHGMGEALHDGLLEQGVRSRIYAPVGGHKELLPYLVRRLLENGANSSFVNQLIDPDLSVDDIVSDPIEELEALEQFSNPNIPVPRDTLRGERLSAKGWDVTYAPTAAELEAAARVKLTAPPAKPIVDGVERDGASAPIVNPATGENVGAVESAVLSDLNDACAAAAAFAPQWAARPAAERAEILRRAAALLETRGELFMRLAIFEAGKTWPDAVAEVREAVDFLRYYAARAEELSGEPLGVVACISPWNFPLAIFLGQVSAGLAAGNCVIAKPAEQTPLIAFEAVKLLHEAGVPASALHYLPGDGPAVGAPLVAHPEVKGVVFTGSTAVAQIIKRTLVETGKHDAALIAETGGINAMIVDSTALLEQAVTDTLASAFQSAGQRCSACRLVCVQEDVADRFKEMLAGAMAELAVGDPAKLFTDVGPVIDEEACDNIERHIAYMEVAAHLIARARDVAPGLRGTFVRPAAFALNDLSDLKEEIFGPVLHVVAFKAKDLDKTVERINDLGFGLTMGVHSRIDETMERVASRARIGNIYVNRNQIGAVVGVQPFGGEGLSGTGPKAGGPHYLKALQRRPVAQTNAPAPVITDAQTIADADIGKLLAAYTAWANERSKGRIFEQAAQSLTGDARDCLLRAAQLYQETFHEAEELPGPTGESNTLKLRGRGLVLCLGAETVFDQLAPALAAGNVVIADRTRTEALASALDDAGAPVIHETGLQAGVPQSLLLDDRLRAVVFDGAPSACAAIEDILARRRGPIIPLLSSKDAPWRFAVERALTINTTAAGGDVRLLSLGD